MASSVIFTLWCASYRSLRPLRMSVVSSTVGSLTWTGWKRRSSAASFSMFLRYSSTVVAPMQCSSPRARAGLSMLEASIEPSAAPAPTTVCSSSMNRICPSGFSEASSTTCLRRSSNWPRYCVPATSPERSRASTRLPARVSGTSSLTILWARPSTMAVLPTPGSPISTGLFLVRRDSTSMVVSTSSARPITGSSLPSLAIRVRSRLYSSSVGVELLGSRASPLLSTPRTTAPRSPVCESPKRESSLPTSSSSAASASSTCSGPYVGGTDGLGLLVGSEQGPLRIRGQRGRHILASFLSGLLLQLGTHLVGVGVSLSEHPAHHPVLQSGVEQVLGVQIRAPPLRSLPGRSLQQLVCGVGE